MPLRNNVQLILHIGLWRSEELEEFLRAKGYHYKIETSICEAYPKIFFSVCCSNIITDFYIEFSDSIFSYVIYSIGRLQYMIELYTSKIGVYLPDGKSTPNTPILLEKELNINKKTFDYLNKFCKNTENIKKGDKAMDVVNVKKVRWSGPVTIVTFEDDSIVKVRHEDNATFNLETAILYAFFEKNFGKSKTAAHKELRRLVDISEKEHIKKINADAKKAAKKRAKNEGKVEEYEPGVILA